RGAASRSSALPRVPGAAWECLRTAFFLVGAAARSPQARRSTACASFVQLLEPERCTGLSELIRPCSYQERTMTISRGPTSLPSSSLTFRPLAIGPPSITLVRWCFGALGDG